MKCLIASDLHYNLRQLDWLLAQAPNFDLIIIAGDLLDIANVVEIDTQVLVVSKYLENIRKIVPVGVCSGNHDGDIKNAANEYVADWLQDIRQEKLYVDGDSFSLSGFTFSVFAWWDGPETRKEVEEQLKRESTKADPEKWIWIYHSPPQDSPTSWTGKKYFGDEYLNQYIEEYHPRIVFSGHVHYAPFREGGSWNDKINGTSVFNAGMQIGPEPAHLCFDLENDRLNWYSLMDMEQFVDLPRSL